MIISRQDHNAYINYQPMKKINKFKYLCSTLNDKWNSDEVENGNGHFRQISEISLAVENASEFQITCDQM